MAPRIIQQEYLADLPREWVAQRVSELGKVFGGSTPSRAVDRFWGGNIPWVTPGELSALKEAYLEETRETITRKGLESCGAQLLPSDTLLVTSRATIGNVALARKPVATNQGFKSIVFGVGNSPHFYYHLFKRLVPELERRASGTTFLEISSREFSEVRVPRPPLPEQHQIALILDTLDKTIRKTEQLIDKLEQVKQGLLHDLLTRGIDDNGVLRDPDRHPEQFKDSVLGRIPIGWELQELSQFVDPTRPIVYGILMPGRGYSEGVPVIKVKDIVDGEVKTDDLLLTSPSIDNEYRRSRLRAGDLLFTIRGTVGRTAFVPRHLDQSNITQDTARIAICGCNPDFVREYLEMPVPQRFIDTHTIGVAVKGINLRDVRRIPIVIPPLVEADEIAFRLSAASCRIANERIEALKLQGVKQGLMEDLLTGRVRVTSLLE